MKPHLAFAKNDKRNISQEFEPMLSKMDESIAVETSGIIAASLTKQNKHVQSKDLNFQKHSSVQLSNGSNHQISEESPSGSRHHIVDQELGSVSTKIILLSNQNIHTKEDGNSQGTPPALKNQKSEIHTMYRRPNIIEDDEQFKALGHSSQLKVHKSSAATMNQYGVQTAFQIKAHKKFDQRQAE